MEEEEKLENNGAPEEEQSGDAFGFLDHVEELRKRIIWGVVGYVIACIISAVFIETLMNKVLLAPATGAGLHLQNLQPFGIPFLYFKVIFIAGLIIAFPFMLYQLWRFVAPGLYANELRWAGWITFFTSICFLSGVAFAYFVMVPSMLQFAATFGTENIVTNVDINEYFGFITLMMLASGIIFEMPMLSFILARVGILKSVYLTKYWRHSIIVILVIAAVATPTPDPINQSFFALPLLVLYVLSIWVAKIGERMKIAKRIDEDDSPED